MSTLRRCPVCRITVKSSDSSHCPACGAILDRAFSDAENIAVNDIIRKFKQQSIPSDDAADAHISGSGSADGRDIAEVLSEAAFQSILNENRGSDKVFSAEDTQAVSGTHVGHADVPDGAYPDQSDTGPDDTGEERVAPFSTVLGSYRQAGSSSRVDDARHTATKGSHDKGQEFNPEMATIDSRSGHRDQPEQAPPAAPKLRTWWGATRQTLWLLLVLLLCIIFFRIFGPVKKKSTIEDFFKPGNPDIEFLDAIEVLEKYYENQRKKTADNKGFPADESFAGGMPQPADRIPEDNPAQASDSTPVGDSLSPASRGPMP